MARKRIKTLANQWDLAVEQVLASCARLNLTHVRSESSLLAPDEAERVKAELQQQAERAVILGREKVVETSEGKVVEKRLTATVTRRRHSEPVPGPGRKAEVSTPFHFEVERGVEAPFEAQLHEEAPRPEPRGPLFTGPEAGPEPPAAPEIPGPEPTVEISTDARQEAQSGAHEVSVARPAPAGGGEAAPEVSPPSGALEAAGATDQAGGDAAIDLTRAKHPSAPSLDDRQRGPKVLGKIDLRARPQPRVAAPSARGGQTGRFGQADRQPAHSVPPEPVPVTPPGQAKPGARAIRRRKVVKKGSADFAVEREMRGRRVPRKRRALPGKEQKKTEITTPKASKRVVRVTEGVTVGDLARNMGVKAGELIKKLMELGQMATVNQLLDVDTAILVANEFDYTVENVAFDVESALAEEPLKEAQVEVETEPRSPVVTVMGHVDHGKTSLLDAIRHAKVAAREFGGITQHVGAYTVDVHGKGITFIDTPGHEAFTAMRARGAQVTDIVVLVVAANDGVMPQTVEAINHARAANVPIVVAINKIDLPDANVDRVKQQLAESGLIAEDYGGDTITVPVSARSGEGLERLLEMILLQAELMELKASRDRLARGTVIEAQLDRGRGPVATVLVQQGTLREGDAFVCGLSHGHVRAMLDHLGQRLSEAGPSTPVEIFGLSSVPDPGDSLTVVAEESKARQVSQFRRSRQRQRELQKTSKLSLEDLSQRMIAGETKELKVIVKGDVQGSVGALADALGRLSTEEVKLEVIHASAGAISETDVSLASASNAIVIGFNVRAEPRAVALAEREGVEIRLYTVIYEAISQVREAMEGLLAPTYQENTLGRAEVRKIFSVPGGTVAGSMVAEGKILRGARGRLVRDGRVVWEGRLGSLRRFKEDAREVLAGYECGIGLENFNDIKPGDLIEAFELQETARKLETPKPEVMRGQSAVEKQLHT